MIDEFIFNVKKLVNRDRKSWPVTVRKYELFEDGTLEENRDRGRRVKNPDTGNPEYEFLREHEKTLSIPRKYLSRGPGGHPMLRVLKVQTGDGARFAPVKAELDIELGDELENDKYLQQLKENGGLDMDFIVNLSRFQQIAKNELEKHYEVTQTEDKSMLKSPMVQLLLGAIGIGVFYFMLGLAAQKATAGIGTAGKSVIPLLMIRSKDRR